MNTEIRDGKGGLHGIRGPKENLHPGTSNSLGLVPATMFLLFLCVLFFASCSLSGRGLPPEQPIAFSHKVHVADRQVPCLYCHRYADRSPVAGVPAVKTCMACHEFIGTDEPEVRKLAEFWEESRPIEWIKVFDLPDFVRFSHKGHLRAGVDCEECHGPVRAMDRVLQVSNLKMGWCLQCHKKKKASVDCLLCHY